MALKLAWKSWMPNLKADLPHFVDPSQWCPKDYHPAQTPQHCGSTSSFLFPIPQCPKSFLIATGSLEGRLTGNVAQSIWRFLFFSGSLTHNVIRITIKHLTSFWHSEKETSNNHHLKKNAWKFTAEAQPMRKVHYFFCLISEPC